MNITYEILTFASREEWLAARRRYIGASDSPAILGYGYSGQNAATVWYSKTQQAEIDKEVTEAMEIGIAMEGTLVGLLQQRTNDFHVHSHAVCRLYASTTWPWLACTPDALAFRKDSDEMVPVEFKNLSEWNKSYLSDLKYQIQLQHQMAVLGAQSGILAALIGGRKFEWAEIPRHDEFIDGVLLPKLEAFWQHVTDGAMPEDDHFPEATKLVIDALHPDDNGETVELNGEHSEAAAIIIAYDWQIKQHKNEIVRLEKERLPHANTLTAAIGDNTYALLPNGQKWSWKTVERKGYEVKKTKYRTLRRCKDEHGD